MNPRTTEDTQPWYRQFWPWFVLALPASVVVAGITTVVIAFKHADSMVDEDYFKSGMAINRSIERELLAEALQLGATLDWNSQQNMLALSLAGVVDSQTGAEAQPSRFDGGDTLLLKLEHPVDESRDIQVPMAKVADGQYQGSVESPLTFRYYLKLEPLQGETWRLKGEMDFSSQSQVLLGTAASGQP